MHRATWIVLALASCASPGTDSAADKDDVSSRAVSSTAVIPLQLELPPRYEAWREPLLQEWAQMNQRFPEVAARWPRDSSMELPKFRVVVPENSEAAHAFYRMAGLDGDPIVPRTFPSLGLAVVPLPRNDALVAALRLPMTTWLHGFRHECAHLLSLDRPGLRDAPSWFQEGFAELWCQPDAGETGRLTQPPHVWPSWSHMHLYWSDADAAPTEALYSYYGAVVAQEMRIDAGATPWQGGQQDSWRDHVEIPFVGLRGRHADWDGAAGRYLLATRPGQHVDLDLPELWDGQEAIELSMQLGRSPGSPEAGLVLFGSGVSETRIRLRYGLGGGFTAYLEEGETAAYESFVLPNERESLGIAQTAILRMDGDLLYIEMLDFERSFDLKKLNLRLPFRLRMVVRDGAFLLHTK